MIKLEKTLALRIILGISIAGMLFSGYLSYTELFKKVCALGGCSLLGGVPVCIYGFFMYLLVFVISLLGLLNKK
jgi:uncharacterized membrane protein